MEQQATTALATDLARIHAALVRLEQENYGATEPNWLNGYGFGVADLEHALTLAKELDGDPDSIPRILGAYSDELDRPLREAQATYQAQPQDGSHAAHLAEREVRGWEIEQRTRKIDPITRTITFRWRLDSNITLRWDAPGKVTVVDMDDPYLGTYLGWWLLLTTRDAARQMMRLHGFRLKVDEEDFWNDFAVLRNAPDELDWIVSIDDYCDLGGRALVWAEQNLTQWAPDMEVTRPRRVRMYQLEQARQMVVAGIKPVLATPTQNTVVVTSEQDAVRQRVEHYSIPQSVLEDAPKDRYGELVSASKLTDTVRERDGDRGSARYTAARVRGWQGPKAAVEIVEGKNSILDLAGNRRFQEEFPDTFPGALALAEYAYPGARVWYCTGLRPSK